MLRERAASATPAAIWFRPPAGLEGYAHTLDVSTVTDAQFAVVRSFLVRVQELAPEARRAMALRLATPIAAAMHHQAPPGVHPELFLVCVAATYQRRRWALADIRTGARRAGGLVARGARGHEPRLGMQGTPWLLLDAAFLPALAVVLAVPLLRTRSDPNLQFLSILALLTGADALFVGMQLGWLAPAPFDPLRFAVNLMLLMITVVGGQSFLPSRVMHC